MDLNEIDNIGNRLVCRRCGVAENEHEGSSLQFGDSDLCEQQ
jgi:hypothetical protein